MRTKPLPFFPDRSTGCALAKHVVHLLVRCTGSILPQHENTAELQPWFLSSGVTHMLGSLGGWEPSTPKYRTDFVPAFFLWRNTPKSFLRMQRRIRKVEKWLGLRTKKLWCQQFSLQIIPNRPCRIPIFLKKQSNQHRLIFACHFTRFGFGFYIWKPRGRPVWNRDRWRTWLESSSIGWQMWIRLKVSELHRFLDLHHLLGKIYWWFWILKLKHGLIKYSESQNCFKKRVYICIQNYIDMNIPSILSESYPLEY